MTDSIVPSPTVQRQVAGTLPQRTFWGDAWRRLCKDRFALLGGVIVLLITFVSVAAPRLAPYDPAYQHRDGLGELGQPLPSSAKFPLGTDNLGRDVLSRLLWGARVSFIVGVISNVLSVALSVVIGAVAGYAGGWGETVLMRLTDMYMGFPALLLAVSLIVVFEPSTFSVIASIALVNWTFLARMVHAEVHSIKARDYILAARAVGVPGGRILVRHVLPHLVSLITVYLTLGIASTVMLEATLSYLGVGIQPPTSSWGNMINQGQPYYRAAPWLIMYPGLAIIASVLGFNLLGDGLRDALDPRQWM